MSADLDREAWAIVQRPASDPRPTYRRAFRRHWRSDGGMGAKLMAVKRLALAHDSERRTYAAKD